MSSARLHARHTHLRHPRPFWLLLAEKYPHLSLCACVSQKFDEAIKLITLKKQAGAHTVPADEVRDLAPTLLFLMVKNDVPNLGLEHVNLFDLNAMLKCHNLREDSPTTPWNTATMIRRIELSHYKVYSPDDDAYVPACDSEDMEKYPAPKLGMKPVPAFASWLGSADAWQTQLWNALGETWLSDTNCGDKCKQQVSAEYA